MRFWIQSNSNLAEAPVVKEEKIANCVTSTYSAVRFPLKQTIFRTGEYVLLDYFEAFCSHFSSTARNVTHPETCSRVFFVQLQPECIFSKKSSEEGVKKCELWADFSL